MIIVRNFVKINRTKSKTNINNTVKKIVLLHKNLETTSQQAFKLPPLTDLCTKVRLMVLVTGFAAHYRYHSRALLLDYNNIRIEMLATLIPFEKCSNPTEQKIRPTIKS